MTFDTEIKECKATQSNNNEIKRNDAKAIIRTTAKQEKNIQYFTQGTTYNN